MHVALRVGVAFGARPAGAGAVLTGRCIGARGASPALYRVERRAAFVRCRQVSPYRMREEQVVRSASQRSSSLVMSEYQVSVRAEARPEANVVLKVGPPQSAPSSLLAAPAGATVPCIQPTSRPSKGLTPNPSMERTCSGKLRLPTHAAHVER